MHNEILCLHHFCRPGFLTIHIPPGSSMGLQVLRICRSQRLDMGLKRVTWVGRYQGQCRALRPLGHQGYRLRNYKKDPPLCSGYTRKGARCGPVLGPHARTDRTRDTQVAGPRPPAPEDGRQGEGQRLTPDAPRNSGRPSPRGRPPTTPAARSPHRACRPRGQRWAPTLTRPRPQHVGSGPRQPAQWAGSRGRGSA